MTTDEAEGRQAERVLRRGEPVAKAILESFARQFASLAQHYAPGVGAKNANERKYERWARLTVDASRALIAFEEPRLGAVAPPEKRVTRFSSEVSGNGARVDFATMTDAELVRYYQARIAGAAPAVGHVPASASRPAELEQRVVPETPAEGPTTELEARPAAEVAQPEPVAQLMPDPEEPAAGKQSPNVVSITIPAQALQRAAEPARPTVEELSLSLASSIGPDGKPRCVGAQPLASPGHALARRTSGVFNRRK